MVGIVRRRRARLLFVVMSLVVVAAGMMYSAPSARAAAGEVVVLSTTDVGFGSGKLANSFAAAGKTVVYKTPSEWSAMTTADFASYDAVVLADPTCQTGTTAISAAIGNASTWGAAVDGNVILIGTDEQFHAGSGGQTLMDGAAAFVVADAGKTGAYVSLSCYYHGTAAGTPVPMLDDAFGSPGDFTVTGVGCFNDAHIVATHPAFTSAGVTDATLSNWSCSVHEAFDNWPVHFEVLAIAENIGSAFTAPDGSVGTPYILARGVEVISDIDLSPESATNPVGTSHELTAVVTTDDPAPDTPVVGTEVSFSVIDGPHAGTSGTAVTDGAGTATFSYTGTAVGTDTIEATFIDSSERTQRSNRVTKTWEEVAIVSTLTLSPETAVNFVGETHELTAHATTDGAPVEGATVTFNVTAGPHVGTNSSATTDAAGTATFSYVGTTIGVDTIEASFVDSTSATISSNAATKEWIPVPNEPPSCGGATPSIGEIIWPPNHKMVDVSILGITDADGDPIVINVDSIWQDEPTNEKGDGHTEVDGAGVGTDTASIRAERSGSGNGRVYHIGFTASDGTDSCSGTVTVGVPRDQGKNSELVDDGALYDSTL